MTDLNYTRLIEGNFDPKILNELLLSFYKNGFNAAIETVRKELKEQGLMVHDDAAADWFCDKLKD